MREEATAEEMYEILHRFSLVERGGRIVGAGEGRCTTIST